MRGAADARISWNYVDPPPGVVTSYQPHWWTSSADREHVRDLVGPARDSNRTTSGLPPFQGLAPDVIDIQITVSTWTRPDGLTRALRTAGFRHGITLEYDLFHRKSETDPELRKLYMREPEGERRVHIHIRERGRFNQRYRCCSATIFVHRKTFAPNTSS